MSQNLDSITIDVEPWKTVSFRAMRILRFCYGELPTKTRAEVTNY
jgi:hypothetical protein